MSVPTSEIRFRLRTDSFKLNDEERSQKVANRVTEFYSRDMIDRDIDRELRLQRYAKYRMWTENDDGPWPGSSDVTLSDMTEKSMRMQDTLNNAVMAQRPAVNAVAVHEANRPKEKPIDSLLDYQFFVEQPGEKIVGDLADAFINDGVYVAFVPWVKEVRKISQVFLYDPIPGGESPRSYFESLLRNRYPKGLVSPKGQSGWDFRVQANDDSGPDAKSMAADISFYTRKNGRVEAVVKGDVIVYDGPRVIIKDYDDVFHPPRADNLQPPGPHNPNGAQHVILRDFPTIDEIARLQKSGYYDLLSEEDMDKLMGLSRAGASDEDSEEDQRDDLGGMSESLKTFKDAPSHNQLTRLMCFDRYDVDGDGLDEDVIWWVIVEADLVVKAKVLQEVYPLRPDRPRPLAEAALFPVRGRRAGFSMLELMEGLHDAMKITLDQAFDGNTIGILPYGFYRPTSSMQSEVIRLGPGDLFPLSDPQRDVNMPQIGNNQAQGMALNLYGLLQQLQERVTVVGDMQLGRVPAGRSSALRTLGGMSLLAGQGEARPERILRRFFNGLTQIFEIMHQLNQHHLPKGKQIRVMGPKKANEDPFMTIADQGVIEGKYTFDFSANVFNTAKQQMQETMQQLLGTYVNGIALQLGISNADTIYNLFRDYGKALGVDPETKGYLASPTPGALGAKILAEDAVVMIMNNQRPDGVPLEAGGWVEHLQKLIEIENQLTDPKIDTGELSPLQAQLLQEWKMTAQDRAAQQQRQTQAMAAADLMQQQLGGGGAGGRPPTQAPPNPNQNPQVSGGSELMDETLPGAGGGAQA